MTQTIYKYPFELYDVVTIVLPAEAKVLSFQNQNECPTIWALVDGNKPSEHREFRVFGTGHPIPENEPLNYIGTAQFAGVGRSLVFHLFEKIQ